MMNTKKRGKILLSMLMTLSVLGSNISPIFANDTIKTEHELVELNRVSNENLITDGDFESGGSSWNKRNQGIVVDNVSYDTGTKSGCVPSTAMSGNNVSGYIGQIINVQNNTDYVISGYVKSDIENARANIGVRANNDQGVMLAETSVTSTEWKEFTIEINSGNYSAILVQLVKWAMPGEAGYEELKNANVYIDNVTVKAKNADTEDENYEIIWADDFNGTELDMSKWGYELGCVRGVEQQHYVNDTENVYLEDGKLILKATDRAEEDQYINPRGDRKVIYNSGSVRTHGKQEFLYGRIEMRAKLPKGQGVFPAFWTLGADFVLDGDINSQQGYGWARCGEIDIMELIGGNEGSDLNSTVWHTAHTDANRIAETKLAGVPSSIDEDFNNDYHIFGINWSPNKIEWYVDNRIVATADYSDLPVAQNALNRPQYIQMNLAMGGNWPGDVATGLAGTEFDIDYVYYAQNAEQKAAAEEYYSTAPKFSGLENIVMTEGDTPDLLQNVSVTEGYYVDFSIDDEQMFESKGGRTECTLRCSGKDDVEKLATLPAGTYNIHYSAIPNDVQFEPDQWDSSIQVPIASEPYKFGRKTMTLTVKERTFPTDVKLEGTKGDKLSTVTLPEGWTWDNPEAILSETGEQSVTFTNAGYTKTLKVNVSVKEPTSNPSINIDSSTNGTLTETPTENKTTTTKVKTGDNTVWVGYAGIVLLSAMAIVILKKGKEN